MNTHSSAPLQQYNAKKELSNEARLASLKISDTAESLTIAHRFRWNDPYSWGVVLITLGGIFLATISLLKQQDIFSIVVGSIIGGAMAILGILTMIRQVSDRIFIKDGMLSICYQLKKTKLKIHPNLKITTKSELIKIRRVDSPGNDFSVTTFFINDGQQQFPILKTMLHRKHIEQSSRLSKEIIHLINKKLQAI